MLKSYYYMCPWTPSSYIIDLVALSEIDVIAKYKADILHHQPYIVNPIAEPPGTPNLESVQVSFKVEDEIWIWNHIEAKAIYTFYINVAVKLLFFTMFVIQVATYRLKMIVHKLRWWQWCHIIIWALVLYKLNICRYWHRQ